jgi:CubicO group peptidase (beta-lactamase class C family)
MTKSFTVLAILKLRDEGKLSLEDPVAKWLPELAHMPLPTRDTAPLVIRQLLSHSAGFPEDNPWGDQQLAATDRDLTTWLQRGIPFSTPPGTRYEYSNYAFGLLGRIVARASGQPYESYVRHELLDPLHMDSSTLEFSQVPAAHRATGYRLQPDGSYSEEPPLPQGAFGAMGGLLTDAADLGRYVAFHLSAWPARNARDGGPVRRSSVREMSELWTPSNLTVTRADGRLWTARHHGLSLRTHRRPWRRPSGFRLVHGLAAGLRRGAVCHGEPDLLGAGGRGQSRVGRADGYRRVEETRTSALTCVAGSPGRHYGVVEFLG